ncbi:hypothetical protein FVEN_g7994 [Fusarium venenatum]|uniref:Uncharacterized protein n=1 Tax=Fusarium venenatum TaxID=56646 RepID=A0A2L2TFJ3_9HYPO|nr:uncharacterized protein FVRRES_08816 [Fusarium venenatum]KAG8354119.1 hypothetical protein FVEN_g7994 [Fusarium venenatum]KAH6965553.1 hypothetical protein EDB82DRAFT_303755 [Fusarium venenatum]CEI68739.1 unnamed protein product [Fusarium venenatum]
MASQTSPDPLDVLQAMVDDVLVHTGKALRASRKDVQGNAQSSQATLKSKLPESIDGFREALHKLEWDIIDAKSVLMRDIKRIQEQKQKQQQSQQILKQQPVVAPQPVEPQSKSPMVIDLESSPPPPPQDQPMTELKANKPVAPFPDMGMGLPDIGQSDQAMKDEASQSMAPTTVSEQPKAKGSVSPAPTATAAVAPMAPMPVMEQKSLDNHNSDVMDLTADGPHSELNFTNMQFTLAPTNNDSQDPSTTQETSFDLATFAPPEGNDDILGLDDLLPTNNNPPANMSQLPAGSDANAVKQEPAMNTDNQGPSQGMSNENFGSVFDDEIFNNLGTGGGGLADGTGDATYEDLIRGDDDTNFNYMENSEFDAQYFFGEG